MSMKSILYIDGDQDNRLVESQMPPFPLKGDLILSKGTVYEVDVICWNYDKDLREVWLKTGTSGRQVNKKTDEEGKL